MKTIPSLKEVVIDEIPKRKALYIRKKPENKNTIKEQNIREEINILNQENTLININSDTNTYNNENVNIQEKNIVNTINENKEKRIKPQYKKSIKQIDTAYEYTGTPQSKKRTTNDTIDEIPPLSPLTPKYKDTSSLLAQDKISTTISKSIIHTQDKNEIKSKCNRRQYKVEKIKPKVEKKNTTTAAAVKYAVQTTEEQIENEHKKIYDEKYTTIRFPRLQCTDEGIADRIAEFNRDREIPIDINTATTWIYSDGKQIRSYQQSITKTALQENTLVVQPTGQGKTLIAVMVMFNFYRWYPRGKIQFLVPTRHQVTQQREAFCDITRCDKDITAALTGNVRKQQGYGRSQYWKKHNIFFATPQTVQSDISSGSVPQNEIVCIIVDEAHRSTGSYAYVRVIDEQYKNTNKKSYFRVVALSATPSSTQHGITIVMKNQHITKIEVRTDSDKDVSEYCCTRLEDIYVANSNYYYKRLSILLYNVLESHIQYMILQTNKKPRTLLRKLNVQELSIRNILKEREYTMNVFMHTVYSSEKEKRAMLWRVVSSYTMLIVLYSLQNILRQYGITLFMITFITQFVSKDGKYATQTIKETKSFREQYTFVEDINRINGDVLHILYSNGKKYCSSESVYHRQYAIYYNILSTQSTNLIPCTCYTKCQLDRWSKNKQISQNKVLQINTKIRKQVEIQLDHFNVSNNLNIMYPQYSSNTLQSLKNCHDMGDMYYNLHRSCNNTFTINELSDDDIISRSTITEQNWKGRVIIFASLRKTVAFIIHIQRYLYPTIRAVAFIGQSTIHEENKEKKKTIKEKKTKKNTKDIIKPKIKAKMLDDNDIDIYDNDIQLTEEQLCSDDMHDINISIYNDNSNNNNNIDTSDTDDIDIVKSNLKHPLPYTMPIYFTNYTQNLPGMTQNTQIDIIDKFNKGIYNVLVTTSIGEEGLDIGEVDQIINYETTQSSIRNIQRAGRTGRIRRGRIITLISDNDEFRTYIHSKKQDEKLFEILYRISKNCSTESSNMSLHKRFSMVPSVPIKLNMYKRQYPDSLQNSIKPVRQTIQDMLLSCSKNSTTVLGRQHDTSDTISLQDVSNDIAIIQDGVCDTIAIQDNASDTVATQDNTSDTIVIQDNTSDTIVIQDNTSDTIATHDIASDTIVTQDDSNDTILQSCHLHDVEIRTTETNTKQDVQKHVLEIKQLEYLNKEKIKGKIFPCTLFVDTIETQQYLSTISYLSTGIGSNIIKPYVLSSKYQKSAEYILSTTSCAVHIKYKEQYSPSTARQILQRTESLLHAYDLIYILLDPPTDEDMYRQGNTSQNQLLRQQQEQESRSYGDTYRIQQQSMRNVYIIDVGIMIQSQQNTQEEREYDSDTDTITTTTVQTQSDDIFNYDEYYNNSIYRKKDDPIQYIVLGYIQCMQIQQQDKNTQQHVQLQDFSDIMDIEKKKTLPFIQRQQQFLNSIPYIHFGISVYLLQKNSYNLIQVIRLQTHNVTLFINTIDDTDGNDTNYDTYIIGLGMTINRSIQIYKYLNTPLIEQILYLRSKSSTDVLHNEMDDITDAIKNVMGDTIKRRRYASDTADDTVNTTVETETISNIDFMKFPIDNVISPDEDIFYPQD